jgi:hypothetical protein
MPEETGCDRCGAEVDWANAPVVVDGETRFLCAAHAAETWEPEPEPDCEHGLSAWLCAGPQHYPMG